MRLFILAFSLIAFPSLVISQKLITADANTGHRSYKSGEELIYTVGYGFIKGGEGHFTVKDTTLNGHKTHHVTCKGVTTGVPDVFFKVRDVYESYIDISTQLP